MTYMKKSMAQQAGPCGKILYNLTTVIFFSLVWHKAVFQISCDLRHRTIHICSGGRLISSYRIPYRRYNCSVYPDDSYNLQRSCNFLSDLIGVYSGKGINKGKIKR